MVFSGLALTSSRAGAIPEHVPTVLIVDKATNALKIGEYKDDQLSIVKTFRTTVGKVVGDKEEEGDLKTPEGIYTFTSLLTPPSLKPKFGVMAFYVNYPNPFDQIAGNTGFDIMLHATDEPERLKRDFDSEGCIVVNNGELTEIKPWVKLGLTPLMVFSKLEDRYLSPGKDTRLRDFFWTWIGAWEGKNIDGYMNHYHSEFRSEAYTRDSWKAYKHGLNSRYQTIKVNPTHIIFLAHPKYSVVQFTQNYESHLNSGGTGHKSIGTKRLYVAEEKGVLKIIDEDFSRLVW